VAAYATPTQVRAVLSRDLTVPGGTAAELDDTAIQAAIDLAQAHVDAVLAGRYTVPWPGTIPTIITQLTVAIGAYQADLTHRQGQEIDTEKDPAALRYMWAIDLLAKLRSGTAEIPAADVLSGVTAVNPYSGLLFSSEDFDLATGDDAQMRRLLRGPWGA
jgi:phage gp36-like protein